MTYLTSSAAALAVLMTLAAEAPAAAQTGSFPALASQLDPGTTVFVVDRSGHETTGQLARVLPGALIVAGVDGEHELKTADIGLIETRGDTVLDGAGLAAAIMVPFWATNLPLVCDRAPSRAGCAASTAEGTILPFVALGALIDRAHEGRTVRYTAERRPLGPVARLGDLWKKVRSGDTVYLTDNRGRMTTGTFVEAEAGSLVMLVDGARRTYDAVEIQRLDRRGGSTRKGLLTGLVLGAVIGSVHDAALIGPTMVLWGGMGAIIDAGHQGRTRAYQPRIRRTHATVTPRIGWRSAGVVVRF
jgi:hypothetical protein